jgi:putative DNA primase/helicase
MTTSANDIQVAEQLEMWHGKDMRYIPEIKKWISWDGCRWVFDEYGEIVRRLSGTSMHFLSGSEQEISSRIKYILHRYLRQRRMELDLSQLDENPWLLNVNNGTVNLRTGTLRESKREDFITKRAHVSFDASARCPVWQEFLERILRSNQDAIPYLQKYIGILLTGVTSSNRADLFIWHGKGACGKSTVMNIVQILLGDYVAPQANRTWINKVRRGWWGKRDEQRARLRGARLASTASHEDCLELCEYYVPFTIFPTWYGYKPVYKTILLSDRAPDSGSPLSYAKCVDFNGISVDEEVDFSELPSKLLAELPGILNWAIAGLVSIHKRPGNPDTTV